MLARAVRVAAVPAATLAAPEYPVHVDSEVQPALVVEHGVQIAQEAMQRAERLSAAQAPDSAVGRVAPGARCADWKGVSR